MPIQRCNCWTLRCATLLMIVLALGPKPDVWSGQFGAILAAKSAYLDELGQMSQVMRKFVDALLEKVSFLAEIVIESAMEEHCEANCPADMVSLANLSLDFSERPADVIRRRRSRRNVYDPSEFTNEAAFIRALNEPAKRTIRQVNEVKEGEDEEEEKERESACRLFSFSIKQRDLPAVEMESCCLEFASCYSSCNKQKQVCDSRFQSCLALLCRSKFGPIQTEEEKQRQPAEVRQLDRRQVTSSWSYLSEGRLLADSEPLAEDLEMASDVDDDKEDKNEVE